MKKINYIKAFRNCDEPIINSNGNSGFVFEVTYSTRPLFCDSDWYIANNGQEQKNGWIKDQEGYVIVLKKGNVYIFESIGTGP